MKKQTAYVFVAFVLVLLIIAGIAAWAMGFFDSGEDRPEPTETPAPMTAAPTAGPTPTPVPSPTATPTPEPTASPEPSAEPAGAVIASGAFDSATGCGINTRTQWTATEKDGGTALLTLKVYARCYTVDIGPRAYTVTVGSASASGTTKSVSVDSPNALVDTLLFSYSTEVSLSEGESVELPVSVDWQYKGEYSGQTLDVIHSESVLRIG